MGDDVPTRKRIPTTITIKLQLTESGSLGGRLDENGNFDISQNRHLAGWSSECERESPALVMSLRAALPPQLAMKRFR